MSNTVSFIPKVLGIQGRCLGIVFLQRPTKTIVNYCGMFLEVITKRRVV